MFTLEVDRFALAYVVKKFKIESLNVANRLH